MLEEKTDEECTDDNRRTWFSSDHGCDVEIMVAAIDAAATLVERFDIEPFPDFSAK